MGFADVTKRADNQFSRAALKQTINPGVEILRDPARVVDSDHRDLRPNFFDDEEIVATGLPAQL
jgi:hypothetical protein